MLIITDHLKTMDGFLGHHHSGFIKSTDLNQDLHIIIRENFSQEPLNYSRSGEFNFWNYLLINRFSEKSQYDLVLEMLRNNLDIPDKLLLVAAEGAGFHGFRNRIWHAEKGNIHLTIFFRPEKMFKNINTALILLASNAVMLTIDQIPGLKGKSRSKWVNDIVIGSAKISGILTQSFSIGNSINGALIGIGMNVLKTPQIKPDRFTQSAASISDFTDDKNSLLEFVFINLIKNLEQLIFMLDEEKYAEFHNFYCERSAVIGKEAEIYSDDPNMKSELIAKGKVRDISRDLELIMEGNTARIRKGRLAFIRPK